MIHRQVPNILTVSRIILSVIFAFVLFLPGLSAKVLAFSLFFVAACTDYLDGILARKYEIITDFGQLVDPIADKILNFSAFIAFVEMDLVPAWMVAVMIAREIVITGVRMTAAQKNVVIPASKSGKHKTVFQMLSIFCILTYVCLRETAGWEMTTAAQVFPPLIDVMLYLTVALTLYSGARFFIIHWKALSR